MNDGCCAVTGVQLGGEFFEFDLRAVHSLDQGETMKIPVIVTMGRHEQTLQIKVWGGSDRTTAYGTAIDQEFEFSEGMHLRIVSDPTGQMQVWDATAYPALRPSEHAWEIAQAACPNQQCSWSLDCGSLVHRANVQFMMFDTERELGMVHVVGDAMLDDLTVEAAASEVEAWRDIGILGPRLLFVGSGTDGRLAHLSRAQLDYR